MSESELLARRMVAKFPNLEPLLTDHLADMEGELLPYLFLADVARWADEQATTDPDAAKDLIEWLEAEFNSAADPEKDLIALGFVEVIPIAPDGNPLLKLLGPTLHEVARELGLLTPDNE